MLPLVSDQELFVGNAFQEAPHIAEGMYSNIVRTYMTLNIIIDYNIVRIYTT